MNKIGILAYGNYLPRTGIEKRIINEAWSNKRCEGYRWLANYDEDSITMAIEAVGNCIAEISPDSVDGLFCASTSFPYQEKQSAAFIAHVQEFKEDTYTADFGNTLRAGTTAMLQAVAAIESDRLSRVVVVGSEMRRPSPGSDMENEVTDCASAIMLGSGDVLAGLEGFYSH